MQRIIATQHEIDDLTLILCADCREAACQLVKIVHPLWEENIDTPDDNLWDMVRHAVLVRQPNVFAGHTDEERELRKRLVAGLQPHVQVELWREFLSRRVGVGGFESISWHAGGKWPTRLMEVWKIPKVFAGPQNRKSYAEWEDIDPVTPLRQLAPFQEDIKNRLVSILAGEDRLTRCMVTLPTGAGKTRIAVESFIEWMKPRFADNKYLLWIALSEELCEQAIECIREVWSSQEYVSSLRIYRYYGGTRFDTNDMHGGVVVSTINQLYSRRFDIVFREIVMKMGAVIVDEAHRSASKMYNKFFARVDQLLGGVSMPICGLSATPGQVGSNWEEKLGALKEQYFRTMLTPNIPVEYENNELQYFRNEGYLARPYFKLVESGREYELTDEELNQIHTEGDLPSMFLYRMSNDPVRNDLILEKLSELKDNGATAIIYACSVAHANALSAKMNSEDVVAYSIHSATPRIVRREAIRMFKAGHIKFLFNYSVLTTGFDAPLTEYIVICRPIISVVLYEQIVGRGLRGKKFGGTDYCTIIDFRDNILTYGGQMAYQRFAPFWDSVENANGKRIADMVRQ